MECSPRRKAPHLWLHTRKLFATGFLKPTDRVVLFNTGSGLKYIDVITEILNRGVQLDPAPVARG